LAPLARIILYVKDVEHSAAFFALHFGFAVHQSPPDRLTELIPADGGARLLLHKAGKAQKLGQSAVKLVFDTEDVPGFCETAKSRGLLFGSPHQADGYQFANAKDPDGNSLQVSSRAYRDGENG